MSFVKNLFNKGKQLALQDHYTGDTLLKNVLSHAIGEGVEEVSEEFLADFLPFYMVDNMEYINNFLNMVNEKEYNKDLLNEGLVYEDIYKQSSRKTCASLPYRGIVEVLEKY